MPKKTNPHLLTEIGKYTQSNNGNIAELAIKTMADYTENNKIDFVNDEFLSLLAKNIEGKRSILQKKGK